MQHILPNFGHARPVIEIAFYDLDSQLHSLTY